MKPRIGLIGLTAELYRRKVPGLMAGLEDFSRELAGRLGSDLELTHVPVVCTRPEMEAAVDRIGAAGADGLILVFLSYSPSLVIAPALRKLGGRPVLIWNTQKLEAVGTRFSGADMFQNHGMHGVQDLASVMRREGLNFQLITGHYRDAAARTGVNDWCRAAAAAGRLRRARLGRLGGRFEDMGDFAWDDRRLREELGPQAVDLPVSRLVQCSRAVPEPEIGKLMAAENRRFQVDPKLDPATRRQAARLELGLRRLVAEERLDGLGVNFMAFEGETGAEAIPFAAISKLMAEGLGYGGEGDILCAAAVLILQSLTGAGNFIEMFTTDYRNDRIFMSHMGESNPNLARDPKAVRLVRKEMSLIKPGLATTSLLFQLKPGPVTLLNLAPGPDGLSFILGRGRILAEPWFSKLDVPNFLLKLPGRVEDFLTGYSRLGGTHHLGLAYGDQRPALRRLAEQLGRPAFEV